MSKRKKLNSKKLENDLSSESYETCDSEHEVIEILTSDLDSEALKVLSPSIIQKKLLHLAQSHTKNGYQPVKGTSSHPTEELSSGNRVQTIHDSLSPKCLKWRVSNTEKGRSTGREHQIAKTCDNAKIMSEKFADVVFERILPYIPAEDSSSSAIPPITPLYLYVEKKLEDLDQRFHRLQTAVNEAAEFIAQEPLNCEDILPNVIQKANVSLGKLLKSNQDLPPPPLSPLEERMMDLTFEPKDVIQATSRLHHDGMADQNRQTWPSLWNHLRLQKLNFWRSLIDNEYIPSAPKEITNQQSYNPIPSDPNGDEGFEILRESKKGEKLRTKHNSV